MSPVVVMFQPPPSYPPLYWGYRWIGKRTFLLMFDSRKCAHHDIFADVLVHKCECACCVCVCSFTVWLHLQCMFAKLVTPLEWLWPVNYPSDRNMRYTRGGRKEDGTGSEGSWGKRRRYRKKTKSLLIGFNRISCEGGSRLSKNYVVVRLTVA